MIAFGFGTSLLGGFMIALDLLGLDPEMADAGTGMVVALYVFGVLFICVGVLLVYTGFVKNPRIHREIEDAMLHNPHKIKRYWRWVVTSTGRDTGVGVQNYIKIEMSTDKVHQISVTQANIEPFLQMLAEACPEAAFGPPS
ncbi:MAG: hypothetical protein ACPG77_13865 [Nannocystaceae bacterium]